MPLFSRPLARDPRYYQIGVLGLLAGYGGLSLGFDLDPLICALLLGATLLSQYLCARAVGLGYDPKSALISGLSLCLLLRTDSAALALAAGALAIGSKFLLRWRGKHLFNPTNLALVTLLLVSDGVWVSPGQWGQTALTAFALGCLGLLVLTRARRAETTLGFLAGFGALLLARAWWLGDPLAIPLHQLQSGALLIFAFFMISDPKTTPDARWARLGFGLAVAVVAFYLRFYLFQPNALLFALALTAPLVPLADAVAKGPRYRWLAHPPQPE